MAWSGARRLDSRFCVAGRRAKRLRLRVARGGAPPHRRVKVGEEEVQCDMLLLAVGRTAHTASLALGNAGISVGAHGGVLVDDRLQTTRARVFAAGDCIDGNEQFTHLAGKQGFVAARNAMFWGTSAGTVPALPRCTFTAPEVAAVGLTAEQAAAKYGDAVKTYKKAVSTRSGAGSTPGAALAATVASQLD